MGNFAENLNLGNRFRPPPPGQQNRQEERHRFRSKRHFLHFIPFEGTTTDLYTCVEISGHKANIKSELRKMFQDSETLGE